MCCECCTGLYNIPMKKDLMPKAQRKMVVKVLALLERVQAVLCDPSITKEEISRVESALKPGRRLLALWEAKRTRHIDL